MVAHFQHIRFQKLGLAVPVVQQVILCCHLHVPGEQEHRFSKGDAQYQRGVVGFGVGFYRPQYLDVQPLHGNFIPRFRDGDFQSLLVGVVKKIVKDLGSVGFGGGVDRLCGVHRQHTGQAAYMVFVGVSADYPFQFLHALLFQKGYHQLAVLPIAAVNEQVLPVQFHQGAVRLAHVQKMHRQGALSLGRGLGNNAAGTKQQRKDEQQGQDSFFHRVSPFSSAQALQPSSKEGFSLGRFSCTTCSRRKSRH